MDRKIFSITCTQLRPLVLPWDRLIYPLKTRLMEMMFLHIRCFYSSHKNNPKLN